jgi:bifunctional NMN adenylyltransferase/nudix hydrolase
MTQKYDCLVLIGRFQPVHSAHVELIRRAVKLTKDLIIIVGSAHQPRTFKNPWSSKERMMMLNNAIDELHDAGALGNTRVHVEDNIDTIYNDNAWMRRVQGIVSKYRTLGGRTGIIGHNKDDSSFYLTMFPQWEFEEVELLQPLNASNVRDLYFRDDVNLNFIKGVVPVSTYRMLEGWVGTPDYHQVIKERAFVTAYKKQYESLPYPPIFVTADSVVICSGHILMIKRRAEPGKGLWALPGGYVNANTDKSVKVAAIRELREETGIKVPAPVLEGSIVRSQVFDAIDRSPRGRIITHCFLIMLGAQAELPKVKGGDDAEKAKWIPLNDVSSETCFEDHFEIIQNMVGA